MSPEAERRYRDLVAVAPRTVVALDFDGTLSPIVDDPAQAHIHPDAPEVLAALAGRVRAVAIVTGRPVEQVLALGGLEAVADRFAEAGAEFYVFGQYGNERWSSSHRTTVAPPPAPGLVAFLAELPGLLRAAGAEDAHVEDKGLAVAIHTRRMADGAAAFQRLKPVLAEAAEAHDLVVEPGRQVIEVRSGGSDKGMVVDRLIADLDAGGVLVAGDDLGDVEAFEVAAARARAGLAALLVCAASDEESALMRLADVAVAGPDGVLALLRRFAADVSAAS